MDHHVEAIRELARVYARAADRRCFDDIGEVFAADGVLVSPAGERRGPAEITAALEGLRRYDSTFHLLGQHQVHLDPDGASATGEVYCVAHHLRSADDGSRTDRVMYIRYQDDYVLTDGRWRIARRELAVDWTDTLLLRRR